MASTAPLLISEWLRLFSPSASQGAAILHRLQEVHQGLFQDDDGDNDRGCGNFYEDAADTHSEFCDRTDMNGHHRVTSVSGKMVFEGDFVNGLRQGRGVVSSADGDWSTEGYYHNDRLVGNAVTTRKRNGDVVETELFACRRGKKHGFALSYSRVQQQQQQLQSVGIYLGGKEFGVWWRRLDGDGWMVTNDDGRQLFLYPDFRSGIRGEFRGNRAANAKHCKVVGVTQRHSVLCPVLRDEGDETVGGNDGLEANGICSYPTMADPYESRTVEVRPSLIESAGEGLFAKRAVHAGTLLAYFNGVRVTVTDADTERSDYSILLDASTALDVPRKFRSTETYRATVGHKVCHSFEPNAAYGFAEHPLFGRIRCIQAIRRISAGEEITCDYKYCYDRAPKWYRDCLEKYLVSEKGVTKERLNEWIESRQDRKLSDTIS